MGLTCFDQGDRKSKTSRELDKKIRRMKEDDRQIIKILLLGPGESGKTTIIKQMKIIHKEGFPDAERNGNIKEVRRNILEAIKEITANMAFLQPPIELGNCENQESLDFIHSASMMQQYNYTQEFFHHVARLWQDSGVRECFRRSSEFQLIDSAQYFLDRIDRIRSDDYIPTDLDILHCRKRTSDIQKIEFEVRLDRKYDGKQQKFCMYDVGGQRGERRKWIQVFDGITAILFIVACSGFDCRIREDNDTNRLEEAIKVFEEVWFSRFLRDSGFILFLNKQDILREKIMNGSDISKYFPEYDDFIWNPSNSNAANEREAEYDKVRNFIKHKFEAITARQRPARRYSTADVFYDNTKKNKHREFYCHFTNATDTNNIKTVFDDIHIMMIMWNLDKIIPS